MDPAFLQLPSGLFGMAFTLALIAGALLLVGVMVSLGVFAYRSTRGDGVPDPEDVAPEKADEGVSEGHDDDEWKYY